MAIWHNGVRKNGYIISRGITILLKATDFPNNFIAKIPSRSFDLCMLSPMCLKQNETANYSNINEMEKESLGPSHTFLLGAKCREYLVWPVNSVHFHVVGLKNFSLLYKALSPFIIRSYSPGHLALFILLPTVVMDTTLLSTHCSTRQGGSLTQCIVPRSRPLAHSWLFLRAGGKLRLLGKIVPMATTPWTQRCLKRVRVE